jgi:hypothetical protein
VLKSLVRTWVRTSVVTKGVRGQSSFWLAIGALGMLRKYFDQKGRKTERIALGERLRPGDELTLRYPGKPVRPVRKEIAEVLKRRAAEAAAHAKAVAELQAKVDKGGFGARRAAKELDALTSTRS